MRIGDVYRLGKLGLMLLPGQASLMGLQRGDIAWGQWVEGRDGRDRMILPSLNAPAGPQGVADGEGPPFNPRRQGPHLVVSSIHPDLWPSALRIDARLSRDHNALDSLLVELANLGVNILALDTTIGGFDLQIAELIVNCPLLDAGVQALLTQVKANIDGSRGRSDEAECRLEARLHAFKEIGRRVAAYAFALEMRLRLADLRRARVLENMSGFLHPNTRRDGHRPWYLCAEDVSGLLAVEHAVEGTGVLKGCESMGGILREIQLLLPAVAAPKVDFPLRFGVSEDPLLRAWDDVDGNWSHIATKHWQTHSRQALSVRALTILAHARVWRAYHDDEFPKRIELQLQDGDLLRAREEAAVSDELGPIKRQYKLLTRCSDRAEDWYGRWPALGLVNRTERFVRLRLLRPLFARQYAWMVSVPYDIKRRPAAPVADAGMRPATVAPDTRGLIASITGAIRDADDLVVERASSRLMLSERDRERGAVSFLVFLTRTVSDREDIRHRLKELIRSACDDAKARRRDLEIVVDMDSVGVHPLLDTMEFNSTEGVQVI